MLLSRKLDDQSYKEIVEQAEGRLPWICPVWTDHNAHDPGITILELMAWYKESQQYQMDQMTAGMKRRLLSLSGIELRGTSAARCIVDIPADSPERPLLSRLQTSDGVTFELEESVGRRARLEKIEIEAGDSSSENVDIGSLMNGQSSFHPFCFGGQEESRLLLGFSEIPEKGLRLYFKVEAPPGIPRREPGKDSLPPRDIAWEFSGAGEQTPAEDGTWALSWSGFVRFEGISGWKKGREGLYWLSLRESYGGCEERVRLITVSATRAMAVQQESRAKSYRFRIEPDSNGRGTVRIESAQAPQSEIAIFLRRQDGWTQVGDYACLRDRMGVSLSFPAVNVAMDGWYNLMAVCLDRAHVRELLFDAKGKAGETFRFDLEGKGILAEKMRLMCLTLSRDGVRRPAEWHYVEDFASCGPRDRVFRYDWEREMIVFGDGRHGALVQAGPGAVMVIDAQLSLMQGGNIPAHAGLRFVSDGMAVDNEGARFGSRRETPEEGRGRLLARLRNTRKCLSAEDYRIRAKETPGLRVAGAKAIPNYDRNRPHQYVQAMVSVAVMPAGEGARPEADRRFLDAVTGWLNTLRSVCIRVEAIPVRYVPFALSIRLLAHMDSGTIPIRTALENLFSLSEDRIGETARRDDVAAALQHLQGIRQVLRVDFRPMDQNSYLLSGGDLTTVRDALLVMEKLELSFA